MWNCGSTILLSRKWQIDPDLARQGRAQEKEVRPRLACRTVSRAIGRRRPLKKLASEPRQADGAPQGLSKGRLATTYSRCGYSNRVAEKKLESW